MNISNDIFAHPETGQVAKATYQLAATTPAHDFYIPLLHLLAATVLAVLVQRTHGRTELGRDFDLECGTPFFVLVGLDVRVYDLVPCGGVLRTRTTIDLVIWATVRC